MLFFYIVLGYLLIAVMWGMFFQLNSHFKWITFWGMEDICLGDGDDGIVIIILLLWGILLPIGLLVGGVMGMYYLLFNCLTRYAEEKKKQNKEKELDKTE